MSETGLAWKSWARRLRRRWTRRTIVSALDFVWLRVHRRHAVARRHSPARPPWAIRLAVNVSLAISRMPAVPSAGMRLVTARPITLRPLTRAAESWRPVRTPAAPTMSPGDLTAPLQFRAIPTSSQSPGARLAARSTRHTVAAADWQPSRLQLSHAFLAPRALRHSGVSGFGPGSGPPRPATMQPHVRREPSVIAPPSMTTRRPRRGTPGPPAVPMSTTGFRSPFAHDTGMSAWTVTPPVPAATMSAATMSALTDHVMRQINDRVRARRERLGKV